MSLRVLLSSTVPWPSIARLAGGFKAASCTVNALAPVGSPVAASRYLDRSHIYRPLSPIASLRRAILASTPDIIVPCDDRAVAQLLNLHATECGAHTVSGVADVIARSLGDIEQYDTVLSRSRSLAALKSCGVRVPDTFPAASESDLEHALKATGFPAVLKSDGSWGGDGVVIARNREQALAAYCQLTNPPSRLRSLYRAARRRDAHHIGDALAPARREVCVQRFVKGLPAASAFACWKGEFLSSIYYDVLVAEEAIGPPNVIHRLDCPQMAEASRKAAARFGLSGLHGLDFIRDEKGDVHVIEINPRATQGGTLAFGAGHDLPSALAARVSRQPVGMREAIPNDVVVLFPREWQRDPASPYLKTGHHDVPWDDPAVMMASLGLPPQAFLRRAKG